MKLDLIRLKQVKSTNDEAIKIIKSKKNKQGIVISNLQTKGKGTMGKKWVSQKGNFFASIFFELKQNMPKANDFSLIKPCGISGKGVTALAQLTDEDVSVALVTDSLVRHFANVFRFEITCSN